MAMFSSVYYDSDDSSYYVDPKSTSFFYYSRNNDVTIGTTAALNSKGTLGIYRSTNPYISFHDGTVNRTTYFQEAGGRFYLGEVDYTESAGSFRAPLFYDTNDTTFYLDPASTSTSLYVAGSITANGSITSSSDLKFKENIEIISNAIEKIKNIRGVTFTRNDLEDKNERHTGVIAQEVEQVLPEAVIEGTDGKKVAYGNMVGLLIEAIKEQQEMIDLQQKDINNLKHQIKNLQR